MTPRYIDTHCHLQLEQYDEDREEIIRKMHEEQIAGIVVGDDYESSVQAVELAEKHWHLFATVGIHPHQTIFEDLNIEKFKELARNERVVAIGECGLDYSREMDDDIKNRQKEVFKQHIALSEELDKPLVVHARTPEAYQDVVAMLIEAKSIYPNLRGNVHFFSGSLAEAQALIALDFTISFTAVITFARNYDEIIKAVPLLSILSETDAPYVAPAGRRGERNDPLSVIDVIHQIATIRGEDLELVRTTLLANAQHQFVPVGDSTESLASGII